MSSSTLDPDNLPRTGDRSLGKGHGTKALGPSDSSDAGSDLQGASGLAHQVGTGLSGGTTSAPEESTAGGTAGPDIGDANLDSDTDSSGTGERAAAARDTVVEDGRDIDTDHIETINPNSPDNDRDQQDRDKQRSQQQTR
jgi:hypothetical protein